MTNWPAGGAGEMLSLVNAFPDHLEASVSLPRTGAVEPLAAGCRRILFCGMGGSAIAGDLVQPLLQEQSVALTVWRDYGLPHWAGPDDLVIAASYSGNTEETLSALEAAHKRGCRLLGVTSGGALAERAAQLEFSCVRLPGGLPPRAALGHGLGALLHLLGDLGVLADPQAEIQAACGQLRRRSDSMLAPWTAEGAESGDAGFDPAPRALAEQLNGRIPVLYTAGMEAHGAGSRWKAQLNENSKTPVFLAAFPELNHNDLVGWDLPADLRERCVLVILEAGGTGPRVRTRVDATRQLLTDEFPVIFRIAARGESPLARILSLVQYGDFLSCHLADLRGVDPMPVSRIEELKKILSRSHGAE